MHPEAPFEAQAKAIIVALSGGSQWHLTTSRILVVEEVKAFAERL